MRAGAPLVIVNRMDTPHDPYATLVLQASAGEVMTRLVDALGIAPAPEPVPLPS
jgi:hypothetical protein